MSNQPYTYCEADSSLYGPDGIFLKKVYCPKAVDWNQLIADDPEDRSRGCSYCGEQVMNLDVVEVDSAIAAIKENPRQCIFASEKSVRFLLDPKKPTVPSKVNNENLVEIKTARGFDQINRAAALGFWPDVRLVKPNRKELSEDIRILQEMDTGRVVYDRPAPNSIGSRRKTYGEVLPGWKVVVEPFKDYRYQQGETVAAYLIPLDLPDGARVIVTDPIEDVFEFSNCGGMRFRCDRLRGYVCFGGGDAFPKLLIDEAPILSSVVG